MSNVQLMDNEKNITTGLTNNKAYGLVFYLSDTCKSCVDFLSDIQRLCKIFGDNDFDYYILFEDTIPELLIKKYGVKPEICYSLMGKTKVAPTTPTLFIVNKDSTIEFISVDPSLFIEKLTNGEYISKQILQENANRYLLEKYFADSSSRDNMVYFAMEGCPDCAEADVVVSLPSIEEKYNIVRIYKYNDEDESRPKDSYKLFKQIYDIQWFPSFLIFDENGKGKVIGKFPIKQLEKILLSPV